MFWELKQQYTQAVKVSHFMNIFAVSLPHHDSVPKVTSWKQAQLIIDTFFNKF